MSMRRRPAWRRLFRTSLRVLVIVALGIPVCVASAGAVGIATLVYGNLQGAVPKARPRPKVQPPTGNLPEQVRKETGLTGDAAEHEAKERIIFESLGSVYFGAGAYGAAAAAQTYLHKSVKDLNASEAAMLVSIIPAPSKYGPRDNITV